MKILNILLIYLIVALLVSCNERTESEPNYENRIVFDISKSVDLNIEMANHISKNTIELAFADSIVIPAYSRLLISDDDFIIYSQRTFQLFRFDEAGSFKNLIGKRGVGPGEFTEMRDVIINSQNKNIIEILDREAILEYQLDGSFVKRTQIDFPAFSFASDNNNYWFYIGNNPSFSQFKLLQTDNNFRKKEEYFAIAEKGIPLIENNFGIGSYLTYKESLNPQLYILNDKIKKSYFIDFGKFKLPEDIESYDPFQMADKLEKTEYIAINTYLENNDYTFLFVMKYTPNEPLPNFYYWIINKNTKEEKTVHIKDFVEESFLLYPQVISDDHLIYFIGYDIPNKDGFLDTNSNPSIIKIQIEEFFNLL